MSDKDCVGNLNSGGKKRQRKKRQASSPLNDNFYSVLDLSGKESVNNVNTGERPHVGLKLAQSTYSRYMLPMVDHKGHPYAGLIFLIKLPP